MMDREQMITKIKVLEKELEQAKNLIYFLKVMIYK